MGRFRDLINDTVAESPASAPAAPATPKPVVDKPQKAPVAKQPPTKDLGLLE